MEEKIRQLGWVYWYPYGWVHRDVRDSFDDELKPFDTVEDVARYLDLEEVADG
jgi:hypothetical protein